MSSVAASEVEDNEASIGINGVVGALHDQDHDLAALSKREQPISSRKKKATANATALSLNGNGKTSESRKSKKRKKSGKIDAVKEEAMAEDILNSSANDFADANETPDAAKVKGTSKKQWPSSSSRPSRGRRPQQEQSGVEEDVVKEAAEVVQEEQQPRRKSQRIRQSVQVKINEDSDDLETDGGDNEEKPQVVVIDEDGAKIKKEKVI